MKGSGTYTIIAQRGVGACLPRWWVLMWDSAVSTHPCMHSDRGKGWWKTVNLLHQAGLMWNFRMHLYMWCQLFMRLNLFSDGIVLLWWFDSCSIKTAMIDHAPIFTVHVHTHVYNCAYTSIYAHIHTYSRQSIVRWLMYMYSIYIWPYCRYVGSSSLFWSH